MSGLVVNDVVTVSGGLLSIGDSDNSSIFVVLSSLVWLLIGVSSSNKPFWCKL